MLPACRGPVPPPVPSAGRSSWPAGWCGSAWSARRVRVHPRDHLPGCLRPARGIATRGPPPGRRPEPGTASGRKRGEPVLACISSRQSRAGAAPTVAPRTALTGVGGVIIAGATAFFLMPASQRASPRTVLTRSAPTLSSRRVVVAPLTNHTGDSTLTGIGALAADWIAQGLMRTTQFEVVDPAHRVGRQPESWNTSPPCSATGIAPSLWRRKPDPEPCFRETSSAKGTLSGSHFRSSMWQPGRSCGRWGR